MTIQRTFTVRPDDEDPWTLVSDGNRTVGCQLQNFGFYRTFASSEDEAPPEGENGMLFGNATKNAYNDFSAANMTEGTKVWIRAHDREAIVTVFAY